MTPEDRELDPDFLLLHQPLTLYRLARARYANLSGIGAAMAPGRWNRKGEEAIYTSTEIGVPVLERMVHTPKDLIPSNLALMKIQISGAFTLNEGGIASLAQGAGMWHYKSITRAKEGFRGRDLVARQIFKPFAIAIPSVIVPVWNIVLFPEGRGFWDHVSLESVDSFEFDPRLFPENVPSELKAGDISG